ncbi:MAG: Gfo/Idh/MocA family oxidoreductase [Anaerolineae bacterium]|nr:Gfo/Idh/MocA family oxidoreductase [Anaerolineae bacterium]
MLKVGILGMGGMGWFHASRYLGMDDVRLIAVADIVPERLDLKKKVKMNIDSGDIHAELSNLTTYSEAGTLIESADVDVIDICLPTDLHAEYAILAMKKGKHVLCEKPMALNVRDADKMLQTAKETKQKLMIAQVLRFWPEYLFLKQRIKDEAYGNLRSLNMWRFGSRPTWSPDNWFLDPKRSGGMMLDLHIHDVDYVNAILALPENIAVFGRGSRGAQSIDVIHAVFSYMDGPQIHMHAGWSPAIISFQAGYDAWFDEAFIRYREGSITIFDTQGEIKNLTGLPTGDAYASEIAYFLDCVRNNQEPTECMPESTRNSIALIEQERVAMLAA